MYLEILSFLPFIIIILLLLVFKVKSFKVMILTYFVTLILLLFVWRQDIIVSLSASIRGLIVSIEVFLIVLSVLLLFSLLKLRGKVDLVKNFLKNFSEEKPIQIILIGWFVVAFFESIAGFGTPAAIAAPLLVILGISPISAVILTLIADSVPVVFGAFGTPIIIGLEGNLGPIIDVTQIVLLSSIFNGIISIFIPLLLLFVYSLIEKKPIKDIFPFIPISLIAGISFAIPYILTAVFLGPELPSVIGSIVGFSVTLFLVRKGIFTKIKSIKKINFMDLIDGFFPYIFLIFLLIGTRTNFLSLGDIFRSIGYNFSFANNISTSLSFYSPGFIILITFLLFLIAYKINFKELSTISKEAFGKGFYVFLTLIFTLGFVQLLLYSGINNSNIGSIPEIIASTLSGVGIFHILFAPFIGAFGSFIAGSATVSNLVFSSLQFESAALNGLSTSLILSLQASGAAAGNMIAIHNILAVSALVGLFHKESYIIKVNGLIVLFYCLILGLLGLLVHLLF